MAGKALPKFLGENIFFNIFISWFDLLYNYRPFSFSDRVTTSNSFRYGCPAQMQRGVLVLTLGRHCTTHEAKLNTDVLDCLEALKNIFPD